MGVEKGRGRRKGGREENGRDAYGDEGPPTKILNMPLNSGNDVCFNFTNFGLQKAQNGTGLFPALTILFYASPSNTL